MKALFESKKKKTISKMVNYLDYWDTEDHDAVVIHSDGRLTPTNNIDLGEMTLCKPDFRRLIEYIENNT